jgi:hypothetical protein
MPNVFGGGEIDLRSLLRALGGRPFQAEIEESFTPSSGAPSMRRTSRVCVSRDGRLRSDVQEDDGPAVVMIHDLPRRRFLGGLADQPETWVDMPWPFGPDVVVQTVPSPSDADPLEVEQVDAVIEGLGCLRQVVAGPGGGQTTLWLAPKLGIPVRIESADAEGTRLYRLHRIRFEEPATGLFPD